MTVAREQPEHRQRILCRKPKPALPRSSRARGDAALAAIDPKAASRLILMASAPFVLPWMLRTQPFGNPRSQVEPLIKCLVTGLAEASATGAAAVVATTAIQPELHSFVGSEFPTSYHPFP